MNRREALQKLLVLTVTPLLPALPAVAEPAKQIWPKEVLNSGIQGSALDRVNRKHLLMRISSTIRETYTDWYNMNAGAPADEISRQGLREAIDAAIAPFKASRVVYGYEVQCGPENNPAPQIDETNMLTVDVWLHLTKVHDGVNIRIGPVLEPRSKLVASLTSTEGSPA